MVNESLDFSIEPAADWHLSPQERDRLTDLLDGYLIAVGARPASAARGPD